MKKYLAGLAIIASALGLATCQDDNARIASENLSRAADNFEVPRRVVFMNGITDQYMLEIVGLCSIEDEGNQLEVTCKTGDRQYKKHFLGLSDNVTYFVEQLEGREVSVFHYRVTFKPQAIIPDIDLQFDGDALLNDDSDTMGQ